MNKKWLSLGTTVLLKNGTQPIMIVGRYQQGQDGKVFDYSGVLNPQGYEEASKMCLFDQAQIKQILFEAPNTHLENAYLKQLNEFIELTL